MTPGYERAEKKNFFRSLRATFKVEAVEHVQTIAAGLLRVGEKHRPPAGNATMSKLYSAPPTVSKAPWARAVNFTEIESVCQSLENVFAAWKREKFVPLPREMDAVHRLLDAATEALNAPEASAGDPPGESAASHPSPPAATAGDVGAEGLPETQAGPDPGPVSVESLVILDFRGR